MTAGCISILDRNWRTKNSRLIGGKLVFRLEGSLSCRGTSVPANPDPLPQHNKQSSRLVVDLARQSRFQMDDDGDLHEQILHIEAHIEELTDIIETCRKILLISIVAIAAGGILILAIVVGARGFDATILIGAIATVIGGTVVFGSNTSTLKQTVTDMKAAVGTQGRVDQQLDTPRKLRGRERNRAALRHTPPAHPSRKHLQESPNRQARYRQQHPER